MRTNDAPSQYFFKLVQAKLIHESIKKLLLEDGQIAEDESEILQGVFPLSVPLQEGSVGGQVNGGP